MAIDSIDPVTGSPQFLDGGAPDLAVDQNAVSNYAAKVGTRLIGTTAERTAYAYGRKGLEWYDTDLNTVLIHNGSGWQGITVIQHVGGTPLDGPSWDGVSPLIMKHASITAVPNASSVIVTPWIEGPFPHGLISFAATPGDGLTAGKAVINASSTKANLIVQVLTSAGTGVGSATQRINYMAVGW